MIAGRHCADHQGMPMLARTTLVFAVIIASSSPLAAEDRQPDSKWADSILEDSPITLVFRRITPWSGECTYSINSAGACERTIHFDPISRDPKKPTRQKFEIPAEKMTAIRQALRSERFFNLKKVEGLTALDSGWTTLMVSAGSLTATQHFDSPNWAGWTPEQKKAAAPAMRIYVAVCDAVDPEGKVFTELPKIKEVVRDLSK
jgi:hypothetical protein